jgi:hypothetical protein
MFDVYTVAELDKLEVVLQEMIHDAYYNRAFGICKNLSMAVEDSDLLVTQLGQLWPKFSGECMYPIPSTSDIATSPEISYLQHQLNTTLWEGEQGYLRRELCQYIFSQVRDYRKRANR